MRANLYVDGPGGLVLVDGNLTNYNNIYSNAVDVNDAWKMPNPGINFGILRTGYNLVVERRSVYTTSDTTFFRMWNMQQCNYRIKFMLKNLNHPGMQAMVVDTYLNTATLIGLNDTTFYNFSVTTDPASATEDRFRLIYGANLNSGVLDVNIISFTARKNGTAALLNWEVADEEPTDYYVIEYSADGRHFSDIGQVVSSGTHARASYNYAHAGITATTNFYRVRAVSRCGQISYSGIVKVAAEASADDFNVYPNPVTNHTAVLYFNAQESTRYEFVLYTRDGRSYKLSAIGIKPGNSQYRLALPAGLNPGVYYLHASAENNLSIVKAINVL